MTDDFFVSFSNEHRQLTIIEDPFPWGKRLREIPYRDLININHTNRIDEFHIVVMNRIPVNNTNVAALLGRDPYDRLQLVVLRLVGGERNETLDVRAVNIPLEEPEMVMAFGIAPQGQHICVVLLYKMICLDTISSRLAEYNNNQLWNDSKIFQSHALIFTEDQRLFLVGSRLDESTLTKQPYLFVASFSGLSPPVRIGMIPLSIEYPSEEVRDIPMSISVHEDSKTMIVGMPRVITVYIFSFRDMLPELIGSHIPPQTVPEAGYSVAMLDANSYVLLSRYKDLSIFGSISVQVNECQKEIDMSMCLV